MENRLAPAGSDLATYRRRLNTPPSRGARSLSAAPGLRRLYPSDAIDPFHLAILLGLVGVVSLVSLEFRAFSTLHAAVALALGIRYAVIGSIRAVYVAGYLATADVLWRMTKATVPWEFGKYGVLLVLFLLMVRQGGRRGLIPGAAVYFALLLPSALLTIEHFGLVDDLRQALSFNLSGPLALAGSIAFFSGLRRPERLDPAKLLLWMLVPIFGVFTLALSSTLRATRLDFGNYANFTTSGGFGPNQVSASLGLGTLLALLLLLHSRHYLLRLAFLGVAVAVQVQNLITFSRGGTFNLVIALVFFGIHYIQHPRLRKTLIGVLMVVAVAGIALVLPKLNAWTSGNLSERFTSLDTTGRKALAEADLQLFRENFVMGVGPGLSKFERRSSFRSPTASHTEFTRLLAEHGVLGLLALGILLLIAFQAYQLAPTALTKGWVAGMSAWSMAAMSHSAMRIVAISFVFGLATLPFRRAAENRRRSAQARDIQEARRAIALRARKPPSTPPPSTPPPPTAPHRP